MEVSEEAGVTPPAAAMAVLLRRMEAMPLPLGSLAAALETLVALASVAGPVVRTAPVLLAALAVVLAELAALVMRMPALAMPAPTVLTPVLAWAMLAPRTLTLATSDPGRCLLVGRHAGESGDAPRGQLKHSSTQEDNICRSQIIWHIRLHMWL